MNSNDLIENLNSIRTVSVKVQTFIHGVCGQITDSMKLYDLKLKEIKVLDKKIKEERDRLAGHQPHHKMSKAKKLKLKMKADKVRTHHHVKTILQQNNQFLV